MFELFDAGHDGKGLFHFIAWLAWAFGWFESLRQTADSISQERREGTLGLLLLTDLRGRDIVLGKMLPAALHTVYAVLAMVPVLGLALLMGGVTGGELARTGIALLMAVALMLTAGMLASANVEDATQAWLGAVILSGLWALPAGLMLYWGFDAGYSAAPAVFWILFVFCVVVELGTFFGACRALRSTAPPPASVVTMATERLPEMATGVALPPASPVEKERRLAENPAFWLALREDNGGSLLLGLVGALLLLLAVFGSLMEHGSNVFFFAALLVGVYGLAALLLTWEGCRGMADLRRSGVMELLATTPLRVERVVDGFKDGLRERFERPVLVLVSVQSLLPAGLFLGGDIAAAFGAVFALACANFWLIAELFALGNAALYFGFRHGNAGAAFGRSVLWTILLPCIALPMSGAMCLWPIVLVLLVAKPFMLYGWAKTRLRTEIPRLTTEPLGVARKAV